MEYRRWRELHHTNYTRLIWIPLPDVLLYIVFRVTFTSSSRSKELGPYTLDIQNHDWTVRQSYGPLDLHVGSYTNLRNVCLQSRP